MDKILSLFKKKTTEDNQEKEQLIIALKDLKELIKIKENQFNEAIDPDQISAYTYEISALRCHQQNLFKQVKLFKSA